MDSIRGKRPLEVIDANSSSSNSSKGVTAGETSYKKPKNKPRSIDAALLRARDVCSSMLPAREARRKTIDQTTFAKGSIERMQYDEERATISFFLVSSSTADDYAELPVVFRGHWVDSHLASALQEHASSVLAFKEASYGESSGRSTANNYMTFECYILFEKGAEFWTSSTAPPASTTASGHPPPLPTTWSHYKLFSVAQYQRKIAIEPVSLRGPPTAGPLPDSTVSEAEQKAVLEDATVGTTSAGQARSEVPHNTGTKDTDHVQTLHNSMEDLERRRNALFSEPASAAMPCRPSPPTGITQIEAGTSANLVAAEELVHEESFRNTQVSSLRRTSKFDAFLIVMTGAHLSYCHATP